MNDQTNQSSIKQKIMESKHQHNDIILTGSKFQHSLIRMLQSKENSCIIQWINGQIVVHDPKKMESQVLHKYYNHRNYTSFQRQLQRFGFRKIINNVDRRKHLPCVYAHNQTSLDVQSIIEIKSKNLQKSRLKKNLSDPIKAKKNLVLGQHVEVRNDRDGEKICIVEAPTCSNSKCPCCFMLRKAFAA